jgi:hypothetical protein
MNALRQLAESEPRPEWKPLGEMGRALKVEETRLRNLILKGHGSRAIYDAWGFTDDAFFNQFQTALGGLRSFMKREGGR